MAEFGGGFDPVESRVRATKAERELADTLAEARRTRLPGGNPHSRFGVLRLLVRRILRFARGGGD